MLQLQDYLLSKYASKVCDENAKSAVRGWFVPMLESDRKSTEMFYRKNNFKFVTAKEKSHCIHPYFYNGFSVLALKTKLKAKFLFFY